MRMQASAIAWMILHLAPIQSHGADSPLLTIMTWNIGYADVNASPAQDRDMPHIASVIRELHPDVVALQEQASPEQFAALQRLLGDPYEGQTTATMRGRGVSILTRLKARKFETISTPIRWKMLAATVESGSLKRPVCVVSCYAPSGPNAEKRKALCIALVDFLRGLKMTTVLAGDFNLDPGHTLDGVVPFLTDDAALDKETYELITADAKDCGKEAGPTALLGRRIDYIFLSPKTMPLKDIRVIEGKQVRGMDHKPLMLTLDEDALVAE